MVADVPTGCVGGLRCPGHGGRRRPGLGRLLGGHRGGQLSGQLGPARRGARPRPPSAWARSAAWRAWSARSWLWRACSAACLVLEGALGGVELGHLGGDVADGQAGVLAGRLGPGRAPAEQGGVGARRVGPRVDVGQDRLVLDDAEVVGDGRLVGGQLLGDLGDGLGVGGHLGRRHRGLLPGGVHLELLEDQALGDGGGLGLEVGDRVRAGRAHRRPEGEGGEEDEYGEDEGPERSTGRPRYVWPRHRGRTGATHKTTNLPAGPGGAQAGQESLVRVLRRCPGRGVGES